MPTPNGMLMEIILLFSVNISSGLFSLDDSIRVIRLGRAAFVTTVTPGQALHLLP